jgi:hypothetical protein
MKENKKKWMELCEQAADEQDPKKLAALILEINFMLEAKELRLIGSLPPNPPTSHREKISPQCNQVKIVAS